MPVQRLIHTIPVAISPAKHISFGQATLLPGISIKAYSGRLAKKIDKMIKTGPFFHLGFAPSHLVLIDETTYLKALDSRLITEGASPRPPPPMSEHNFLDISAIKRQVLIATTLVGQLTWQVGGHYTFDNSDTHFPYRLNGYSPAPTVQVFMPLLQAAPHDWSNDIRTYSLRSTVSQLDCYYRTGSWWADRLSVALGYLWSTLTTTHIELSFVALCMALEAIATSANTEVTHILAERCALLARNTMPERQIAYTEIKKLYSTRSKIVHGRSAPKKGLMTWESLAITAKQSMVSLTDLFQLLSYVIDVINGALRSQELLKILHNTKLNIDAEVKAVDVYFLSLLLS